MNSQQLDHEIEVLPIELQKQVFDEPLNNGLLQGQSCGIQKT